MTRDHRWQRLAAVLDTAGLDAVAFVPGSSFRYLTGGSFALMERPTVLIVRRTGRAVVILPALEQESWNALDVAADTIVWTDEVGFSAAFAAAAARLQLRRIGVEGLVMRVVEMQALQQAFPNAEVVDAQAALAALRLCKDEEEILALRQAIGFSETALARTLADIRIGMTEVEIEGMLIRNLFTQPISGLSFPPIVLAADNAARPHGHARHDYRLKRGDALLFDFGATASGYAADITRTVFLGDVSAEHRELYDTVLTANTLGREICRAGMTAHAVDDAVRGSLERSRFGAFVVHKTGHGLGLDVHEAPQVMRGNQQVLQAGTVITIEPGLYKPGDVGVRIEDNVCITAAGSECLTSFPRELTIVG